MADNLLWVNVYLTDRAYGGPEEGGWGYDYGLPELGIACFSDEEADEILQEMRAVCDMWNEGRRPVSSVLSDGIFWATIEDDKPKPWPEERPHYE